MKYTFYSNKQEIDTIHVQNQTEDSSSKNVGLETVHYSNEVNDSEINSINSDPATVGDFAMYEPGIFNVEASKGLATEFATADNETKK